MANPIFYVACPLGDKTGGPEALTLLVEQIRARGFEAFLIPMWNFRGRAVHPEYASYDYRVAEEMKYSDDAHLILTEVSPIESFRELQRTPDANIWMLWLSVNFSPIPAARYYSADQGECSFYPPGDSRKHPTAELWPFDDAPLTHGAFRTLREARRRSPAGFPRNVKQTAIETASIAYAERVTRRKINFGTQSYYGRSFVRSHLHSDAFLLTDFPREISIPNTSRRPNLVLYNGAKGRWKIDELRSMLPEVTFHPIQNMTYREVCEALSHAALYVEIGHLPGRDRLPREAARFGTPTIMLARGAGYCWDDFPIGERYRLPYTVDWAHRMAPVIREALQDPDSIRIDQASFRAWVMDEPQRYHAALDTWMERVASR